MAFEAALVVELAILRRLVGPAEIVHGLPSRASFYPLLTHHFVSRFVRVSLPSAPVLQLILTSLLVEPPYLEPFLNFLRLGFHTCLASIQIGPSFHPFVPSCFSSEDTLRLVY